MLTVKKKVYNFLKEAIVSFTKKNKNIDLQLKIQHLIPLPYIHVANFFVHICHNRELFDKQHHS